MNRTNLMILLAAVLVASACGQLAIGADLCTGAVDPYDIVSEKGRFYTTAGKDNELSAQEFLATKSGKGAFRRPFDKWSEMQKFDRDGNKSLDWLEADTYRYAMRKMVLAAYDANKDGKLGGTERQSACKALAAGKIRFPVKRSAPPPPPMQHPKEHKRPSHKPSGGEADRRHDARSHQAEEAERREARIREAKKRHKEHQAGRKIEKFDRNKDGRLDENEIAERDGYDAKARQRKAEIQARYGYWIEKYDKDGDGKLNEREKAAAIAAYRRDFVNSTPDVKAAAQKRIDEWRHRKEVEKYDKNKDGRLDAQESAALDKQRSEKKRRKEEFYEKYDSNRDGKISSEEKSVYLKHLKEQKEDKERDRRKARDKAKAKAKDRRKDTDKDKREKDPSKRKPRKSSEKKHSRKDQ